jgi:hypothetical protein
MFSTGSVSYLIAQMEKAPTTGTIHLQGALIIKSPQAIRIPQLREIFASLPSCHWSPARQWDKLVEYCRKAESKVAGPWERGALPRPGQRSDLAALAAAVQGGKRAREVALEDPGAYVKYHKGLRALEAVTRKPYHGQRRVALFWGETGTGKTRAVYDSFAVDEVYSVADTRTPWFDGYEGERVVLFDEMGLGSMDLNILKRLTDRYPTMVPIKGGMASWMANTVIMTANTHWTHWYPKGTSSDFAALQRRARIFKFPEERQAALNWIREDPLATGNPMAPYIIPSDDEAEVQEQNSDDEWGRLVRQDESRDVLELSQ